jgi:hypothetical protein
MAGLSDTGRGFDRSSILVELSQSHLMTGDPEAAVAAAQQSIVESGPEATTSLARAHIALGGALAALGDREGSQVAFVHAAEQLAAIKASREAARAWVELGNMLAETGDAVGAVRAFQRATAELHLGQRPVLPQQQHKPQALPS